MPPGISGSEARPTRMTPSGQSGATRTLQPLLLLSSHCNETLGRDDNSIAPLKLKHGHLHLFPHRLTFGGPYLLKKRPHLWKGIPSVLHRCGERREPLGACYDLDGHFTEAGSL